MIGTELSQGNTTSAVVFFPKNSTVLYYYVFICVGEYLAMFANNSTLFYLQKLEERKTMLAKFKIEQCGKNGVK